MTDKKATGLDLLREPFPPNQISLLPKPYKKDSPKGRCNDCGGYHGLPAVHLSYVGHAALTDRLLNADPHWTWEPLALHNGLPALDETGGLWIRLTICGITRLGYGDAQGKQGGDAMKERIGDALRNAAMRFGAALDLWHKGDLHAHEDDEAQEPAAPKIDTRLANQYASRIVDCVNVGKDDAIKELMVEIKTNDQYFRSAVWASLPSSVKEYVKALAPSDA